MSGTITRIFGDSIINAKTSKEDFDIIKHSGKEVRYKAEGKHIFEEWGGGGGGDENAVLKKFLVHFRRSSNYKGEFGFDWMRDEYIYPIVNVSGTPRELSLDVNKIETEYKATDVLNPISPYGKDYYCSWLTIKLNQEAELDIEIEELEALTSDATEVIFESSNPKLTVTPQSIPLNTLISGGRNTKKLGEAINRDYYSATNQVKIKCDGAAFTKNEQIKVFARLGTEKVEIGKMMVLKNSDEAKYTINVYVIKSYIIDDPNFEGSVIDTEIDKVGGLSAIEDYLNKKSLNQALIQVKFIPLTDWVFRKNTLLMANKGLNTQIENKTVDGKKYENMITDTTNMIMDSGKYLDYIDDTFKLKYSKIASKKAIFLYLTPFDSSDAGSLSYTVPLDNKQCIIFSSNLDNLSSYAHEIGHVLGLQHTFLNKDANCNPITLETELSNAKKDLTNAKKDKEFFLKYFIDTYKGHPNENAKDDEVYDQKIKIHEDTIKVLEKNKIRFIPATTENIMDYDREENCATPPVILYNNSNKPISFNKYQWLVMQEEAKQYYHQ